MTDDELLQAVGAWDGEQLTYAGLALFGSTVALRRLWPSLRVDVITTADTLPKRVTLTNASLQRTESLHRRARRHERHRLS